VFEVAPLKYVSSHSKLYDVLFEGDVVILGRSVILDGCYIGLNCVIGYPSGKSLEAILPSNTPPLLRLYDNTAGAKIGRKCIIRSNTIIYENASLSDMVTTGHGVLIRENTKIGSGTKIGSNSVLEANVNVGKNVVMQSNVYLSTGTRVENNVFLGPNVVVANDKYPPSSRITPAKLSKECIIGANATILPGVTVGARAVVAAGAVVTRTVPAETVVAGSPARKIATRLLYDKRRKIYESQPK